MSRYANFMRTLATSYGLLLFNIAYSLAMVPLALGYLGKENFGLWALTVQVGAVVQLADVGMTGALNRILLEYKDDKYSIAYRQTFYTMWLIFSIIGVIVVSGLFFLAPWLTGILGIPADLRDGYTDFMAAYGLLLGMTFAIKPFQLLPYVHQRSDLMNLFGVANTILGFVVLWMTLRAGWGLWSLLASQAMKFLTSNSAVIWVCLAKRYLPRPSTQPRISRAAFYEVWDFGKTRIFITLGSTALHAAPTFLITRILGLEANAVWSVVSRMNQLCFQVISKISDFSYPALAEMHVRGEHGSMRRRYSHLLVIASGTATLGAIGIAVCNRDFVHLWTGGKIQSSALLDATLGLWLFTLVLQKMMYLPAGIARDIKDVRFSFLSEALFIFGIALLLVNNESEIWRMPVILAGTSMCITIPWNAWKTRKVLHTEWRHLLEPFRRIGLRILLPATALLAVAAHLPSNLDWFSLLLKSLAVAVFGILMLSTLPEIRTVLIEALRRFPIRFLRRKSV